MSEQDQAPPAREGGRDCPHCPNQGWYVVAATNQETGEAMPMQEQCRWCHETPDSKFTQAREGRENEREQP